MPSDVSDQGGNQEGAEDDLSRARIHRESLLRSDASFSSAVSFGSIGEGGETEGDCKGTARALCGRQTDV